MSKMTKSLVAASVLAATSLTSGVAMAEVSMNIGATSNYIFRGVTASDDDAAISGGIDYAHDSGFYAGLWTSTLSTANYGSELDLYLGYGGAFGDIGYDVHAYHISNPQVEDSGYVEVGVSGSYSYFTAGLESTVSSDASDDKTEAQMFMEGDLYYYASVEVPMADDYTVGATVGSYTFDEDGDANTDLDYTHYQLAVTKSAGDFGDITLAYDQNDIDDSDTTDDKIEDAARISVSWGKSF